MATWPLPRHTATATASAPAKATASATLRLRLRLGRCLLVEAASERRRRRWATPAAMMVALKTAGAMDGAQVERRVVPLDPRAVPLACARGGWQGRRGVSAGARKQCMHGWCWSTHDAMLARVQAGHKARVEQRAPPMGGMEGPRGLCSGAGRVGSSVGSVGDALLLWSGPLRRAAEVALLAPLGGARRSREWSAWATTGAAVWGQATLPPRPTWGGVTHHSVLTRGRPSWPARSKREISAWHRAEPRPPTEQ